ncbi:hypothetical protein LguiA_000552 [Lonicera macranthoides]
MRPRQPSQPFVGSSEGRNVFKMDLETLRDVQLRKLGKYTTEFMWLGSAWTCRKRRRHYQSFQRNGVKISVHDFVYVLAEEDKRLVAYLDDMYEDSRGNKMVVVRWFHKIDEVGIVLPHNYNDREIFFSLCLQDLSIECIDGLASVLSPQHYEKFLKEATHTQLVPFLCNRQFDNNDAMPFDITQVKGYWNQEILKYMFAKPPLKANLESQPSIDCPMTEENCSDAAAIRPKKRLRRAKDCDNSHKSSNKHNAMNACFVVPNFSDSLMCSKGGIENCSKKEHNTFASLPGKFEVLQEPHHLTVGSQIEVLSQDSGIRGCWFRALIIKKHKDKVKVRYEDIKDAADESKNLEEWILASQVAVPDEFGIRICGRATARPASPYSKGTVALVGSVVDAWWHDGWWEGIVVRKESEDRIHVCFPGEKRESVFGVHELRSSQEWLGTGWKHLKERPELVTCILSCLEKNPVVISCDSKPNQVAISCNKELVDTADKDSLPTKSEVRITSSSVDSVAEKLKDKKYAVRDLLKDDLLAQLKWNSSRKRKNCRNSFKKLHYRVVGKNNKSRSEVLGAQTCEKFFICSSLKVDHDNCSKYIGGGPLFSSSVVSPLTNLVMSR